MTIDTNTVVSMTDANQNFSKVTRVADKFGKAVVFKNNHPRYLLINMDKEELPLTLTDDEKIDIVARRVLNKYLPAFKELAK